MIKIKLNVENIVDIQKYRYIETTNIIDNEFKGKHKDKNNIN